MVPDYDVSGSDSTPATSVTASPHHHLDHVIPGHDSDVTGVSTSSADVMSLERCEMFVKEEDKTEQPLTDDVSAVTRG